MKILLLEPFFSGSHKSWAEGYTRNSQHELTLWTMPGRHWKWRMHGGSVTFANKAGASQYQPDLILATDMLDLATFKGLSPAKWANIPVALYFHENQLTYPWSPNDHDVKLKRDNHYSFINYTSALAADKVYFNSEYHKRSFLQRLPAFLQQFPDQKEIQNIDLIKQKSAVLPLGMDLSRFDSIPVPAKGTHPLILWNHRWEYDKNPKDFFQLLFKLKEEGIKFELAVLGEQYKSSPSIFAEAATRLSEEIIQFGYAESWEKYAKWLKKADILPVTSYQDFFGGSIVEAMYCNCIPILPKRLAYPEHIPEKFSSDHLYSSPELLHEILRYVLINHNKIQEVKPKSWVKKYNWSELAPKYDLTFQQIVK